VTTFRQFLQEKYGDPLPHAEWKALGAPSAKNYDTAFRIGLIAFDQQRGLGQTPNNQEVDYLGFGMELYPQEFLGIVHHADRSESAAELERHALDGVPFGSPMLYVKVDMDAFKDGGRLNAKVTGHEGRARTWAFRMAEGDEYLPVHVILRDGLRAKDLSPEFFEALRAEGIVPEAGGKPRKLRIGRVFWKGTER
jgi:hypothetical protein